MGARRVLVSAAIDDRERVTEHPIRAELAGRVQTPICGLGKSKAVERGFLNVAITVETLDKRCPRGGVRTCVEYHGIRELCLEIQLLHHHFSHATAAVLVRENSGAGGAVRNGCGARGAVLRIKREIGGEDVVE